MSTHSADQHCKAGSAPSSSKQNSGSRTWTEIQRIYASQQTSHIEARYWHAAVSPFLPPTICRLVQAAVDGLLTPAGKVFAKVSRVSVHVSC